MKAFALFLVFATGLILSGCASTAANENYGNPGSIPPNPYVEH